MSQTTEQDLLNFSAMLASKLCHDLLSPVSALLNAVELLEETDQDQAIIETAQELLADSAKQTARKLTFFRLAFGAAGGADRLEAAAVKQAAGDYMQDQKAALTWKCGVPDISLNRAKVALNMMALLAHCLPRGGELTLSIDEDEVALLATGPRLIVPEHFAELVDGALAAETAREIMATLCAKLLQQAGGAAKVTQTETALSVKIDWAA